MTRRQPLLIAGCLLGSMGWGATAVRAQNGVAYAGDLQSIDRAVLESAELPLPAMASGPVLTPRTAPQGGVVQAAAAVPLPGAASRVTTADFNSGVRPSAVDQPRQQPAQPNKPGLFSKLKPTWLFGGEEQKPAVDPFGAATQDARIQTVGAATDYQKRSEGVQRIPAYVPSHTSSASLNKPATRTAAASQPKLQPTPAGAKRPDGLVLRNDAGPKQGFLSGLWGSREEKLPPKPQAAWSQAPGRQPAMATAPRVASSGRPSSAGSAPLPSTGFLANSAPANRLPSMPLAKPSLQSAGVVMVSDEPSAAPAKPSLITQVSPEQPLGLTSGGETSQPSVSGLTKSAPKVKTLENRFATSNASAIEEQHADEPAEEAIFTSDHPQAVAAATPSLPTAPSTPAAKPTPVAKTAPAATTAHAPTTTPTPAVMPPNPTAGAPQGPVVVSLPPRPMPAPLPADASARELAPASQGPTTYANTAASRPEKAPAESPTTAPVSERAKSLLTEAHQLAAIADTADEFSAVLQRCSYVLAIDNSQEAVGYANQLAGWALAKRGEAFENEGRLNEAEADYLDALRSDPECWRAEHALGVLAAHSGNADEAARRFNRTLELNPEFAKAYSNRAALAVQRSDYEAALRDYQQAIEIDPDFEAAHTGRGRVCHMLGLLDEGLQHLDAAELLAPTDAMIATGRGDILVDLGRYGQAKQAYERAISLDPQSPAAYRNLAWMQATCPLAEYRDGDAAVANAERAATIAGGADDLTLDTKAAALAAAGRFEEAAQVQQEAISAANPADAAAYRERLALYQQGTSFTSQPVAVRQATYMK